jgi:alpha-L-fucosidase
MDRFFLKITAFAFLFALFFSCKTTGSKFLNETPEQKDERMAWWRDARFGMFIHWGLYAIPAGEWDGKTEYGEWIRHTAQIPLETYDQFVGQFNPTKFNADAWVKMAKDAGMKYIVITSKHHDGFSIYDSKISDFDVMATPFKRDILKELAAACQREGIRLCFYHSIMDWHHPDYLPRRPWEKDRSTEGADYDRYVQYMKSQLTELCTNYGEAPHVLWFDGEWENTWTSERGTDLYAFVRKLKPNILINNRVGAAREGMAGLTKKGEFGGDFGTPEQEIPATGLPGVDWESCMTMNNNWGYNRADKNFKSTKELIHNLADIASKGGNFLLNVGPTAEGTFPQESIDRLREIGEWMKLNSDAIYGTTASPFDAFDWGRVTMKRMGEDTWLYLHIFKAPKDGIIMLNGVANEPGGAQLLADPKVELLPVQRSEDALVVQVPEELPDPINTVVVLVLKGKPDIHLAPKVVAKHNIFIDKTYLKLADEGQNIQIRYTLDGLPPTAGSPVYTAPVLIENSVNITARSFRDGKPISGMVRHRLAKVEAQPASGLTTFAPGLQYFYFEGDWQMTPDFDSLTALKKGVVSNFDRSAHNKDGEKYGFEYRGLIRIPQDGVYSFFTGSDDGSKLWIDNKLLVDNDGLHGMTEKSGVVPLQAGYHELLVRYFNGTGGHDLKVSWEGESFDKQAIPNEALFHVPAK